MVLAPDLDRGLIDEHVDQLSLKAFQTENI